LGSARAKSSIIKAIQRFAGSKSRMGWSLTAHVSVEGRRQITGFFVPGEIFGAEQGRHKGSPKS
jgi:hypothetical protein